LSLERRAPGLPPSKLILNHLRKLIVAVVVLNNLDQLNVR
jgi:hypothetical protein